MSDEPIGTIEKDILKGLGVKYPFVKGNDVVKKYRVRFLPSTYSVDSNGAVYTVPDGWLPDELVIDELLHDVEKPPALPPEKRWDPLRGLWLKHEFGAMRAGLDKIAAQPDLDGPARETLAAQGAALDKRQGEELARVAELAKGPDYAGATLQLERIERAWRPLPPAVAAKKELVRFAGDEAIKKEVAVGRLLAKIMVGVDTSKPAVLRQLLDELDQFRKKHVGTFAGKRALQEFTRLAGR